MSEHSTEKDAGWTTVPTDQPDRCPSIDPHDVLQCTRLVHDDDHCRSGGIAWRKGTPRYISDAERLADVEEAHGTALLDLADLRDAAEWAIAQVESHPVRKYATREVTGYMVPADEWRKIRAALRTRPLPPEGGTP